MAMAAGAPEKKKAPGATAEWYELRTIRLRIGAQAKVVNDFLAEVMLPALGKAGAGPIGVFETMVGPEMPTLHLLIPYESPAAMAAAHATVQSNPAYTQGAAAAAFHGAPATQPAYGRMESALLQAFPHMPKLLAPARSPRIFELRTYESPGGPAHARKMEMFTKLGETEIFRRVGLTPVFFGRTVIGPRLPNFTYMLTFPDMAAREKAWATFRSDAEWTKLKSTPGYADADILSNITDLMLRPTAYSQI